jgi:cytoskeletal protein RodZ
MRAKKRINWTALSGLCIGIGLLAVLGAFVFSSFGKPKSVDPKSALPELSWIEPSAIRIGAVGTEPSQLTSALSTAESPVIESPEPGEVAERAPAPTVIVIAAVPAPPTATSGSPTAPEPTATAAELPVPVGASAASTAPEAGTATAPGTAASATDTTAPSEPPPGAEMGVTYCGNIPCGIGLKCCCDRCVPFEEECDPRSCNAQSGLSISVPCGMDLCDPGEICCDARCGQCAPAGQCPEEACN